MWVSDLVRKYGLEEEKFNDFVVNDPRINATYLSHNNTMDVLISAPAEADVMNMYAAFLANKSGKAVTIREAPKAAPNAAAQAAGAAAGKSAKTNAVAVLLRVIAIVTYAIGFLIGILMGGASLGGFSITLALVYWVVAFIAGSMMLGFSEIIKLLQDIKNSAKP